MEHSTKKKLAVSLAALFAILALFASLSAAAHDVPDRDSPDLAAPIINPAIDQAGYLRVVGDALGHRARHRLSRRSGRARRSTCRPT